MTKKSVSNPNVRYQRLHNADEGFIDLQFKKPEPKIPWKGILLAVFLFVIGTLLISVASFLFTGHLNGTHYEGAWPLLILGILMFIPGIYHVRIAYYAYKGYPGYLFDDIPDFD